jgi:DNA-binding transcriptional LysR family regulator
VRVSATDAFATLFYGTLAALREAHPDLTVEMIVASGAVDLARGDADIAVRLFRETQGDVALRKIGEVGWSLYAAPSYLASHPFDPTRGDLAGHDVVGYSDMAARSPGAAWLAAHGNRARVVFRGSTVSAVAQATKAAMGVTALPCFTADVSLVRLVPDVIARSEVFLVTPSRHRRSRRVRLVCDALAEAFARDPACLDAVARPAR